LKSLVPEQDTCRKIKKNDILNAVGYVLRADLLNCRNFIVPKQENAWGQKQTSAKAMYLLPSALRN
jgi:hypothetical protein